MNPLKNWIVTTLAEEDAKAAEEKAEAEKQKRLERLEKQIAIAGILDSWGFPTVQAGQFDPDTAEYCVPSVNPNAIRFHLVERWGSEGQTYLPFLCYCTETVDTAEEFATILRTAGLEEDIPQRVCHQCFKATSGDDFCSDKCQAEYHAPQEVPEKHCDISA